MPTLFLDCGVLHSWKIVVFHCPHVKVKEEFPQPLSLFSLLLVLSPDAPYGLTADSSVTTGGSTVLRWRQLDAGGYSLSLFRVFLVTTEVAVLNGSVTPLVPGTQLSVRVSGKQMTSGEKELALQVGRVTPSTAK
jgi:hypothetical protein